jgi:hypothetical protein
VWGLLSGESKIKVLQMHLRDSFDVTGSCNKQHFFTQGHSEIQYLSSKSISDGDNEGDNSGVI